MANQFFIPHFRGAGSPGSPGVGSTQRRLQDVEIGKQNIEQNQFKLGQAQENARLTSVLNAAVDLKNLPDDSSKLDYLLKRKERLIASDTDTQDTDEMISLLSSGRSEEANELITGAVNAGIQKGLVQPEAAIKGFTLDQGQARFDASGKKIAEVGAKPLSELDQAKIAKLKAETNVFNSSINTKDLDTLVAEAPPELQEQAKAAYSLSGGGDKGVKAAKEVLETGVELERRAKAPEILRSNFPQADESELRELQAVVDAAKTTESGFKAASELREKQRQVKKGKIFQQRAVELIDRILGADELNDVIGSFEGSDESIIPFGGQKIRGDAESQIIADIDEVRDILTADNLDIMSGVLSETDIKIIANLAGGAFNRKRSEEAFISDVKKVKEKLQNAIGVVGGNKLPEGTKDNGDGTFTLPSGLVVRRKRD